MKSGEYLAFTIAQAGVDFAVHATSLLDAAKGDLHLAEEESETIDTITEGIRQFKGEAIDVKSVVISGTLRGALGLGGEHSRPLSATVTGYALGAPFTEKVTLNPKDTVESVQTVSFFVCFAGNMYPDGLFSQSLGHSEERTRLCGSLGGHREQCRIRPRAKSPDFRQACL